ncbi:hypothetical protein [uncultured Litoreibacter sp.]|uniref:hypothetical protein n=1 Tax=uncultured Litoreibacter sp. TaxID=1392394 RepID=UPI0026057202|nr:hypothetical protein [uncultured Litoreibacter sp.]
MNFGSLSDLGQNLMLRRQSAGLKANLARLTNELTTGERHDLSTHLRGGFGPLAGLERSLSRLDAFEQARNGLDQKVTGIQTGLQAMQSAISTLGADLTSAASLGQAAVIEAKIFDAPDKLNQVVSYLNTEVSGQYLFSGTASQQRPLVDGDEILDHIRYFAGTASNVSDFTTQVESWFHDSGGGFDTVAYAGGDAIQSDIQISNTQKVSLSAKADDPSFRSMLKSLAIVAIVSEGTMSMSDDEKQALLVQAGEQLITSEGELINMQRDTGRIEAALGEAGVSDSVERGVLEMAKSKIVYADPFETASELEAVQFQIESLYVLTARTSQLRLSDYI